MTMQILLVKRKKGEKTFVSRSNEQIALARQRIGTARLDELRWLVRFAYTDLDSLNSKALEDLGWEFAAFSFPRERVTDTTSLKIVSADVSTDWVGVPEQALRPAHAILRKGLDDFFFGSGWKMTQPEIFERLKKGEKPFYQPSVKYGFPNVDATRIRYAFELVKAEWERLWTCKNPRCARPFVTAKKGRGLFCSPRCNAYWRITVARILERLESNPHFTKKTAREKFDAKRTAVDVWKRKLTKQRVAATPV